MKKIFLYLALPAVISSDLLHAKNPDKEVSAAITKVEVRNLQQAEGMIFVGGQPDEEELTKLAKSGIKHIVNLRPKSELDWDEEKFAKSLGMSYINIPVSGVSDLTKENAQKLAQALTKIGKEPALLHCGSGNRVGALIAIREVLLKGKTKKEALSTAKKWGLTAMKPAVSAKLTSLGH